MNPLRFFILFCLLALTSALSLPGVQAAEKQSQTVSDMPWVWPPAPEKPRIQHIKTFITPQDLGVKKGFFAKLWEFIAGADTVDRIISPHGIVADGNGKVYVADWGGKCVHFFDFD